MSAKHLVYKSISGCFTTRFTGGNYVTKKRHLSYIISDFIEFTNVFPSVHVSLKAWKKFFICGALRKENENNYIHESFEGAKRIFFLYKSEYRGLNQLNELDVKIIIFSLNSEEEKMFGNNLRVVQMSRHQRLLRKSQQFDIRHARFHIPC